MLCDLCVSWDNTAYHRQQRSSTLSSHIDSHQCLLIVKALGGTRSSRPRNKCKTGTVRGNTTNGHILVVTTNEVVIIRVESLMGLLVATGRMLNSTKATVHRIQKAIGLTANGKTTSHMYRVSPTTTIPGWMAAHIMAITKDGAPRIPPGIMVGRMTALISAGMTGPRSLPKRPLENKLVPHTVEPGLHQPTPEQEMYLRILRTRAEDYVLITQGPPRDTARVLRIVALGQHRLQAVGAKYHSRPIIMANRLCQIPEEAVWYLRLMIMHRTARDRMDLVEMERGPLMRLPDQE